MKTYMITKTELYDLFLMIYLEGVENGLSDYASSIENGKSYVDKKIKEFERW